MNASHTLFSRSVALGLLLGLPLVVAQAGEPVFPPSVTERPAFSKPFWLEKVMFISEDSVYVVGIATKAPTLEEGRRLSLENAKAELRSRSKAFASATWQDVNTADLYEERGADGTFTTYRLVVMKAHGYNPLLLNLAKAEDVAKMVARREEKKLQAAREAEDKFLREELVDKRHEVAWIVWHKFIDHGQLVAFCKGGYPESCETIEELDVLIAQLEAKGYRWHPRTAIYGAYYEEPRAVASTKR